MTVYSGNDGVAKVGATPAAISTVTSFTVKESASTDRTDGMTEAWETHLAIKKSWSGTITCKRVSSDTSGQKALTIGTSIDVELYPDGDATGLDKLSGNVIVTGLSDGANQQSSNEISFDFIGNGALTKGTVGA